MAGAAGPVRSGKGGEPAAAGPRGFARSRQPAASAGPGGPPAAVAQSDIGSPPLGWGALVALLLLAAALRLPTLGLQSLWYDEAFTAVHVFNGSFGHMLAQLPHTENTPPLWYLLEWLWIQLAGSGAFALRLISALAGVALVGVMWLIGRLLGGERSANIAGALTAVSPLFVWYSQEARAYALYTLLVALSFYGFLVADRRPSARNLGLFALSAVLALCSHYFAAFLVVPMALWLLRRGRPRRGAWLALLAIGATGAALLPLALAQGGRGAEWIGKLSLLSRIEAVPQYYLTGYSGASLGRGVELLVALPLLTGLAFGAWALSDPRRTYPGALRAVALSVAVAACGLLLPMALVVFGANFFDPRNVIGALVPATAAFAVVLAAGLGSRVAALVSGLAVLALLAITLDVDRAARLQRGDWAGVAAQLRVPLPGLAPHAVPPRVSWPGAEAPSRQARSGTMRRAPSGGTPRPAARGNTAFYRRLIVTVHLGSAPLEYYLRAARSLTAAAAPAVGAVEEIDEVGYPRLSSTAGRPPLAGFKLIDRRVVHGLYVFRFRAEQAQTVPSAALLAKPITPEAGSPTLLALP